MRMRHDDCFELLSVEDFLKGENGGFVEKGDGVKEDGAVRCQGEQSVLADSERRGREYFIYLFECTGKLDGGLA